MSEVSPNSRSSSVEIAAASLVWKTDGPWNATVTQGRVGVGHGTCAYTGLVAGGSCGTSTFALPGFQSLQYFSTSENTRFGSTSPATITVTCSGRYQRSKKVFEYSYWFGMSSMSLMKPIVVCL